MLMSGPPIAALPPVPGMATPILQQSSIPMTQEDTTFTKIFVGGLPYHTDSKGLRDHFEKYGDIKEAVVIMDKTTEKSKGYGFVSRLLLQENLLSGKYLITNITSKPFLKIVGNWDEFLEN